MMNESTDSTVDAVTDGHVIIFSSRSLADRHPAGAVVLLGTFRKATPRTAQLGSRQKRREKHCQQGKKGDARENLFPPE